MGTYTPVTAVAKPEISSECDSFSVSIIGAITAKDPSVYILLGPTVAAMLMKEASARGRSAVGAC